MSLPWAHDRQISAPAPSRTRIRRLGSPVNTAIPSLTSHRCEG
ncbi:hypothetical protein SLNWT_0183 [Streptomyces albus]|uniref:Uncharacterized protein n=1 Tax=Streptomyces albus (strain ATCC 21838 / DSM 41398 / FERM P-419 / JCM 4703 / NBRC 107858) TaxID=1081613 RepID=A0A0B5EGR7_STRA4|nr:hypothetical protein SLNWT_0183 [Streptomyces albus]AOU74876.1 hypothetical protein SLNHY_0185 [Streptomyces albus]AYN30685.1 hypothetical protein DUI70_0182 [Streptomyces albus]